MPSDPPDVPSRLIGGCFFGGSAFIALCGAGVLSLPAGLASGPRLALATGAVAFSLFCLLALWATRRLPRFPLNAALLIAALASLLLCGATDYAVGDGVRSPMFGLCAVAVCMVGAIGGLRYGLALGAAALLQAVAVAAAETHGFTAAAPAATPLAFALACRALVVACSVAGGALIARVIGHCLRTGAEREQRVRGLLNLAADWHWELDHLFRYTLISSAAPASTAAARNVAPAEWLRRTAWQIADLGLSDLQLDAHRADLESHLPFRGLLVRRRDAGGVWHTLSLSGEPTFDATHLFRGYRGVARDVTEEIAAQRAVTAHEARDRELFSRSPSPIFLHRSGQILDANPAAARLFGFASAAAMRGFDPAAFFPAGEGRERMRRCTADLQTQPVGEGRPVGDWQVRSINGRSLDVQTTSVRIDTASGPAVMTVFFDNTARQAALVALRRSEAMLSNLFETSPGPLALSEQDTGRYTLVNPAFCRLTGCGAEELVGRTMAELGLWHDPLDADRLAARLERDDTVADMPAVLVSKSGARVSVRLAAGRFVLQQRDYLVLSARDVTASERQRLVDSAVLEGAPIGLALTRDRRFVQANPWFESMFGWPRGSLLGQPGRAAWSAEADETDIDELARGLLSDGGTFEIERQMRRRDPSGRFWCRLQARAVDAEDPGRGGTIWIAEDVTERRRQHLAQIRQSARGPVATPSDSLDDSRIEAGEIVVASEPIELPLAAANTAPAPGRSSEALDMARLQGKRVLLVEDNPVNMMIGVAMLEHWGLQVTQALDGRMAVDAVHAAAGAGEPFAAVLMDVQMPVMSGHEACRELRRTFPSRVLPIIALTAAALVTEREEALRAGMDDFLTKPIDAVRLRRTLARCIAD